jgi:dipeptidase
MCDTIVVTPEASTEGLMLFGKNSDREPNEAHQIVKIPAKDHDQPRQVACTYIEIPQIEHTFEVLLAKPFWIWGAEMGANEHGLVIGNEAVFTKVNYQLTGGLLGMDLLRLALERSKTSRDAVTVITDLLTRHGQGGNCGFSQPFYYHNSFLIADPHSAWLLETAGPHWAARQVHGICTISNGLSITNDYDLSSPELVNHAVSQKWCKDAESFSFAECYSHKIMTKLSNCEHRRSRTAARLDERTSVTDIMTALRDHGGREDPRKGFTRADVCMHAGPGRIRGSQTTGSMVSRLDPERGLHFLTGTAAPCTSLFKPVWTDIPQPNTGASPQGTFREDSLFWRHEKLHRSMLRDLPKNLSQITKLRDQFERDMIEEAIHANSMDSTSRQKISSDAFNRSQLFESQLALATQESTTDSQPIMYKRRWKQFNQAANLKI